MSRLLLGMLVLATGSTVAGDDLEPAAGAPRAKTNPPAVQAEDLGRELQVAVENFVLRCAKDGSKRVLLVVRAEEANEELPTGLLRVLETEIGRLLEEGRLEVEFFVFDEGAAISRIAKRVLATRELRSLAEAHEFDALLSATYREFRGRPTVRIAHFSGTRRLSLAHAELGEQQLTAAVDRFTAGREAGDGLRPGERVPIPTGLRPPGGQVGSSGRTGGQGEGRPNRPGSERPDESSKPGESNDAKDGDDDDSGNDTNPNEPEPPPKTEAEGLNAGVLDYALKNFGEQVGNGECWTLANNALIAAGAQPAVGYTFGTGIGRRDIAPGDILQFKTARLERGNQYWLFGTPNHTAIVEAAKGDVLMILHQNFGTRTVTRMTLDLGDMVSGEVRAYRPRPRR